jgi:hypothetical protein
MIPLDRVASASPAPAPAPVPAEPSDRSADTIDLTTAADPHTLSSR